MIVQRFTNFFLYIDDDSDRSNIPNASSALEPAEDMTGDDLKGPETSTASQQPRRLKTVPTDLKVGEKKPKLRTSKDVYDRLKWDSASVLLQDNQPIDLSSVFVGYKDRFLGMCELQYEDFEPGGEIPFHRVYYFRTGGPPVDPFIGKDGEIKVREDNLPIDAVFIWDRESRTDLVFKSGNSSLVKQTRRKAKH